MKAKDIIAFINRGSQDIHIEYCGNCYGLTDCCDKIWINIHLMVVETYIHELLHCIDNDMTEVMVEQETKNIVNNLTSAEIIEISSLVILAGGEHVFWED